MKKGLEVYTSDELGAARITIACLVLLPFALNNIRKVESAKWKYLVACGLIGNLFPAFLFAYAETRLASGLAGVLNSLTSLFTLLIGAIFFRQRITSLRLVGILIGIMGTTVLILGGSEKENSDNAYFGLYVVLATIMYGGSLNIIKFRLQGIPALTMASLALFSVGPVAFTYLCSTSFFHKLTSASGGLEALAYIGVLAILSTAIGLILYSKLIHLTTTLFASSSTYLMPIVALLWGLLDGEQIHLIHYAGMAIILAGVFIVNRNK